ncbi:TraA family conjugative transfer protein [Thiopseudomonas alkaliphila]|uniref:TraA family conjugative transfer protein n=1 Tax=Thiopseudomonas alkaliphila TaxID=1697053 RepID=UPI00330786BF
METVIAQGQAMKKSLTNFLSVERVAMFAVIAAMLLLMMNNAMAGGGGDEFNEVWDTIEDWTTGSLGKIIAGAMILVGIIGGVARQSLMAFAIGIAGAMGLNYAPDIISAVMTSSIEGMNAIDAAKAISNGLF